MDAEKCIVQLNHCEERAHRYLICCCTMDEHLRRVLRYLDAQDERNEEADKLREQTYALLESVK